MTVLHLRHLVVAAVVMAGAGSLAGCTRTHPGISSPASSLPSASGSVPTATARPAPAAGQLTDRLILPRTHVEAGTPISAVLVIISHRRQALNLTRGCRPSYAVVLTNRRFPPAVAFPADCSTRPFLIEPGINRLLVTIVTTYRSCTRISQQATPRLPACLHGQAVMPQLPPGRYQAVLASTGLAFPAPRPVRVFLTAVPR
jgi:hypothetical protein